MSLLNLSYRTLGFTCVGAAIASFGNQMQTIILMTFAVESQRERPTDVGVFISMVRQVYGFVGLPPVAIYWPRC